MTIDLYRLGRRLAPPLLASPIVLSLWGAMLVAVTLLQPAGRPVAVFAPGGPEAALAAVVAAGGAILEIRPMAIVAISEDSAFVRRLYEQGPLLVVGARGAGCGLAAAFRPAPRRTTAYQTVVAYLA
jgi:hypothetical protein